MKHTGFIFAIIAGGVALTAGSAMAQKPDGMHRAPISFEQVDLDGNGEISQDEFAARHQARFNEADANGDGSLDRDELLGAAVKQVEDRVDRMIERFDANVDGVLSQDEMPKPRDGKRTGKVFDRMDKDENGSISKAEFDEAQAQMDKHGKGKWRKN
ncbi:EF-hand domain-containing protein [Sedimentitalea sp. XS_ASV28]|uniref:EF-hand domain-containing protein n=1 Tax=Sedimentitalea sp. XS_ASV28 TaxID=3241296 RepID=UPI00351761B4